MVDWLSSRRLPIASTLTRPAHRATGVRSDARRAVRLRYPPRSTVIWCLLEVSGDRRTCMGFTRTYAYDV